MSGLIHTEKDHAIELRLDSGPRNTLTTECVHEVSVALEAAAAHGTAVVLAGGDRFFCNGLDLGWALGLSRSDLRAFFFELGALIDQMLGAPVPIVAAVRGHAMGAGKTLVIACDYRVATDGRALLGAPEVNLGVPNPCFADRLLRLVAGDAVANRLIYGGELVSPQEALSMHLVDEVVAGDKVERQAHERARQLAALPRGAFAASKSMRSADLRRGTHQVMAERTDELLDCWFSATTQALLRAGAERLR